MIALRMCENWRKKQSTGKLQQQTARDTQTSKKMYNNFVGCWCCCTTTETTTFNIQKFKRVPQQFTEEMHV